MSTNTASQHDNPVVTYVNDLLNVFKNTGLSALGTIVEKFHVKEGLEAMGNRMAKSIDTIVAKVDDLEEYNTERNPFHGGGVAEPSELYEALAKASIHSVDFGNFSPSELRDTYHKLLEIGMDTKNGFTVNENACLQYLIEEVENFLPPVETYHHAIESEASQGWEA